MERIKKAARVIEPDRWPDSAGEDLSYWITRPHEERVDFVRRLLVSSFRRIHGHPPSRMTTVGRVFRPEP